MRLKIYNTLSGKKELLPRESKKPLRLFVCGPTVYDLSHIGHARIYIFFDVFVRYLKSLGYKVSYLQNITDIDDKIINRAQKLGITPLKLSQEETRAYFKDMKSLGIRNVKYARATKFIPQIVKQVQVLARKGYAYKIPGDGYYFNIKKFKDYGKLSNRTLEQAEDAVSRIDESVKKRNKGDFCLWKFSKPGEPLWRTPLGTGRPGWHIEDTAISNFYFGPQYEIHGGGLDLKFPHHEAEIAQAEAASQKKPFVKIWMHVGLLNVRGEKMGKSLGNFITIQDFLKKHPANVLRFIIASNHYRSPLDYNDTIAQAAQEALRSLEETLAKLNLIKESRINPDARRGRSSDRKRRRNQIKIQAYEKQFNAALAHDVNTPRALASVFDLVNGLNKVVWDLKPIQAQTAQKWLLEKLQIFGIKLELPKIPSKIKELAAKRELLRGNKQFAQADGLRRKIGALGYKIEDTPRGSLVLKKS